MAVYCGPNPMPTHLALSLSLSLYGVGKLTKPARPASEGRARDGGDAVPQDRCPAEGMAGTKG
jgi:hypothetical protein